MNALTELQGLLKRQMGLDAASIGSSAIEAAVRLRAAACGLMDFEAYRAHVAASEEELQELIEAIVVPETWFFRDPEAFTTLARIVSGAWLPKHATGMLRLLSLPCSTGEEPYSMAMTLLDARLPADRFRIDAIDISRRAIEFAHKCVYGRNSFRGSDLGFRDRHFNPGSDGCHLHRSVRAQVELRRANLFDAIAPAPAGNYDAIFCRNILIYFDADTQRHALEVLDRLLVPGGVLFVAPAESGLLLNHGYKVLHDAPACVFQRARDAQPSPVRKAPPQQVSARPVGPPAAPPRLHVVRTPAPAAPAAPSLDDALRLADQGRLSEAAERCSEHVDRNGPSAAAFHALGLISDASDNAFEAASYYRKALYLDPNHHEALVHLALTLERLGDAANAQVFRNRARRVEAREKKS